MNTVATQNPAAFDFHGPGFFDTTRVAAGPPDLGAEILRTNSAAVRTGAEAMIEKLREIITVLDHEAPGAQMGQSQIEPRVHGRLGTRAGRRHGDARAGF